MCQSPRVRRPRRQPRTQAAQRIPPGFRPRPDRRRTPVQARTIRPNWSQSRCSCSGWTPKIRTPRPPVHWATTAPASRSVSSPTGRTWTNADFIRPDGTHVITDYEDFTGYYANNGPDAIDYGGEAFLDASSVAAQGRTVYDVSTFGALHRTTPCRIRVEGVAPGASLVILDPAGPTDAAYLIPTLQAIDYALTVAHVDILNESFGAMNWPDDSGAQDAMDAANDAAVAAGVTGHGVQRRRGRLQHDHRHREQPQRHRRRRNHVLPCRATDVCVGGEVWGPAAGCPTTSPRCRPRVSPSRGTR